MKLLSTFAALATTDPDMPLTRKLIVANHYDDVVTASVTPGNSYAMALLVTANANMVAKWEARGGLEYKDIAVREVDNLYRLHRSLVRLPGDDTDEGVEMDVAYTFRGDYLGDKKDAEFLTRKKGIMPESRCKGGVCSFGFSPKDGKWYGWSHRAIYGFEPGMEVTEGDCGFDHKRNGGKPYTLTDADDARKQALLFADDVS